MVCPRRPAPQPLNLLLSAPLMEKVLWLCPGAVPCCGDPCLPVVPSLGIPFPLDSLEMLHDGAFSFTESCNTVVCLGLLRGNTWRI